jgi:hypothetical protein
MHAGRQPGAASRERTKAAMNETLRFLIILGLVVIEGLALRGLWLIFKDR